jgi:hypothetical protein
MGRKQQVTGRKLSAISFQLSAYAGEMPTFVSPLQPGRKGVHNLAPGASQDRAQEAGDIPIHWPIRQPSGGSVQNLYRPFDTILPQYWRRWTPMPFASDWSIHRFPLEETTCSIGRHQALEHVPVPRPLDF